MTANGQNKQSFFEQVYRIVRQIPRGHVMSYGQVALCCGAPRMARHVGYAMRACKEDVPWQRVVRSDGSAAVEGQRARLEAEGIVFGENGRVPRGYFIAPEHSDEILFL